MRYVTIEEVVRINGDILGTEPVIRDVGLLASAVDRPAQVVFGTFSSNGPLATGDYQGNIYCRRHQRQRLRLVHRLRVAYGAISTRGGDSACLRGWFVSDDGGPSHR